MDVLFSLLEKYFFPIKENDFSNWGKINSVECNPRSDLQRKEERTGIYPAAGQSPGTHQQYAG